MCRLVSKTIYVRFHCESVSDFSKVVDRVPDGPDQVAIIKTTAMEAGCLIEEPVGLD